MTRAYGVTHGLPVIIVHASNTYGPRQSARAVIPTIISQIVSGRNRIRLGSVHPTRDFSFIDDTVRGFIAAFECEATNGTVVNLGSGFEISIGDTVQTIAELMGVKVEIECERDRLRPDKSEVERLISSYAKAKELMGWEPSFRGLDGFRKGLCKTIEWFSNPEHISRYKIDTYNV